MVDVKIYGKLPKQFDDFPIHPSSYNQYCEIKQRIKNFIDSSANSFPCQLHISESDLNCLYTKGVTLNKFDLGTFKFFSIENDEIIEKEIKVPFQDGLNGFRSQAKKISFTFDEYAWEEFVVYELNGKLKNISDSSKLKIPLLGSKIIEYIFDDRISPSKTQPFFPSQNTFDTLSKLKDLQIRDGSIIFEV